MAPLIYLSAFWMIRFPLWPMPLLNYKVVCLLNLFLYNLWMTVLQDALAPQHGALGYLLSPFKLSSWQTQSPHNTLNSNNKQKSPGAFMAARSHLILILVCLRCFISSQIIYPFLAFMSINLFVLSSNPQFSQGFIRFLNAIFNSYLS